MYECPNCTGNLKFDIARQQLYCEFCGTQMDPYSYHKEKDAQEVDSPSGEYEVTVFICPQCGGEIISEDTTAATFCSFCGGSAILPGFFLRMINGAAGRRISGANSAVFIALSFLLFLLVGRIITLMNSGRGETHSKGKPFGEGHFREQWPVLRKPMGGGPKNSVRSCHRRCRGLLPMEMRLL